MITAFSAISAMACSMLVPPTGPLPSEAHVTSALIIRPDPEKPAAAIEAAMARLASSPATDPKTLIIVEGEYGLEHGIQMEPGIALQGLGSVRFWAKNKPGGFDMLVTPASGCTLSNITIATLPTEPGPAAPVACTLFGAKGATSLSSVLVKNCKFIGADLGDSECALPVSTCRDNVKFQNCDSLESIRFEHCEFSQAPRHNVSIAGVNADAIRFFYCVFYDAGLNTDGGYNIDLEPTIYKGTCTQIRDAVFYGCIFDSRGRTVGPASISLDTQMVRFTLCTFQGDDSDQLRVWLNASTPCGTVNDILVRSSTAFDVKACIRIGEPTTCFPPDGNILTVVDSCGF